ncbi:hypothetical protein [Pseudomonas putida]|uniref:hypothetical protein n=1 Tax=Pseudomonas putida TaxID=303 RepID=UPI002657B63C|nr:hypothetical protein [Pseudomonas putida]MCZ9639619.1 hypothetical protein [Pseudomonas putida]
MTNFRVMSTVTAFYGPQGSQTFRCSSNFPDWNTPETGRLRFKVIVPEGYPQPTFGITHDKVGPDKRWYSDVSDGVEIRVNSGSGGGGGHALYVGTTSKLPEGLDPKQKYAVIVFVSES